MNYASKLSIARKQASKSTHGFQLGAVITKSGRIVGHGFNKVYRTGDTPTRSVHAEEAALKLAGQHCQGAAMLVVRTARQDGGLTMARPCSRCWKRIRESGIKTLAYTTWEGELAIITRP